MTSRRVSNIVQWGGVATTGRCAEEEERKKKEGADRWNGPLFRRASHRFYVLWAHSHVLHVTSCVLSCRMQCTRSTPYGRNDLPTSLPWIVGSRISCIILSFPRLLLTTDVYSISACYSQQFQSDSRWSNDEAFLWGLYVSNWAGHSICIKTTLPTVFVNVPVYLRGGTFSIYVLSSFHALHVTLWSRNCALIQRLCAWCPSISNIMKALGKARRGQVVMNKSILDRFRFYKFNGWVQTKTKRSRSAQARD